MIKFEAKTAREDTDRGAAGGDIQLSISSVTGLRIGADTFGDDPLVGGKERDGAAARPGRRVMADRGVTLDKGFEVAETALGLSQ